MLSLLSSTSRTSQLFNFVSFVCSFPWWLPDVAFHALVRLKSGREGLLVDCGAVSNLAGDRWAKRASVIASQFGQGTDVVQVPTTSVEGVGTGSSKITHKAKVPVCTANGIQGIFEASIVSDSDLPALMGLETLEKNKALIDVSNRKLIYVGSGGYELKLSPGSVTMSLEKVPSGHLLLPSSEWASLKTAMGQPLQKH